MNTADAVPVFERNFDRFLNYLQDVETGPAISPKRYGQVLRLDMQTLAAKAHVHRNTISRAPDAESVQRYLRESVRVMRAAVDIAAALRRRSSGSRTIPSLRSTTRHPKTSFRKAGPKR
jgi:hypothetical protein